MRALIVSALIGASAPARADEAPPVPPQPSDSAPPDQAAPPRDTVRAPTIEELSKRIEELEDAQRKLASQLGGNEHLRQEIRKIPALERFLTVFVDAGAFVVGGNGSGIRSDLYHLYYPQYAGRIAGQWVFMGDPLTTAINSLGEPADTSNSREIKTNSLKAGGNPSLILSSLGLAIRKDVGHDIRVEGLTELLPRPGSDVLDVELASVVYHPAGTGFEIAAGKIDSVLGVEYRSQDAPRRLTVTPSQICRYLCGRTIGLRAHFETDDWSLSSAIVNGDFFDKRFEPESSLHANALPTIAAHVQYRLPFGQGLWIGASGALGAQVGQPDEDIAQWHVGVDARLLDTDGFEVTAEYVHGIQQGKTGSSSPCDLAPCLSYQGAYLLADRRVNEWLVPYVRIDWRDALHESGAAFVYESHVARATIGAHFAVTSRIVGKVEYTHDHELDNIPQFANDVLTSSIVVATD